MGTYQFTHEGSRGKVVLQKHDQISLGQKYSGSENEDCRLDADSLAKCVEAGDWKHKGTNQWKEREQVDSKRYGGTLSRAFEQHQDCIQGFFLGGWNPPRGPIHVEIGIVHYTETARVLGYVLCSVGAVDPIQRFHETMQSQ
jgi:hypothetical protein